MRCFQSLLKNYVGAVLASLALLPPALALAETQAPEPELKAAIMLNMLLFIDWPMHDARPINRLTVCYLGDGPVANALVKLDGNSVKGRTLKVVSVNFGNPAECMALYITPGAVPIERILGQLGAAPILIASDSPEYFQHGVMLNLELVGGRIVFDIDLRSTQKAGLQVSSKALRLARQVVE